MKKFLGNPFIQHRFSWGALACGCFLCSAFMEAPLGSTSVGSAIRCSNGKKNGKWYVKYLKIKLWKDLVPTHVGKQGFSKDHLDTEDLSIHYLDAFLLETCRGEWDHSLCAFCAVPVVIFNPFPLGLISAF